MLGSISRHCESKKLGNSIQHTIQRTYTQAGEDAEKLEFYTLIVVRVEYKMYNHYGKDFGSFLEN